MTTEKGGIESSTIPLIRDAELRLAKMRRQLEEVFVALDLARDEVLVSADAACSEGQFKLENVLRMSVANKLFGQLKLLTHVIERLGGKTPLSEDAEGRHELTSIVEKGDA